MMIQTQELTYEDHSEEIRALSKVLDDIKDAPDLQATTDYILGRLDQLMLAQQAKLKLYDQRGR